VGERVVVDKPIRFEFAIHGVPRLFEREAEEQLLHIGQEALHNAVRHANPNRVTVELHYEQTQLRLVVSDDGRGFDASAVREHNGHFGLVSMRERASQVGGMLTIASHPGQGTKVEARIPAV
jgi:signal transduction histidine kinase